MRTHLDCVVNIRGSVSSTTALDYCKVGSSGNLVLHANRGGRDKAGVDGWAVVVERNPARDSGIAVYIGLHGRDTGPKNDRVRVRVTYRD